MGSREELQIEIDGKIQDQKDLLSSYFYALGMLAFGNEDKLEINLVTKLKTEVEDKKIQAEEAEAEYKKLSAFHEEYIQKSERHDVLEKAIEACQEKVECEKIKLGAIIYEQCSLSLLDNAIFSNIYKDVQNEQNHLKRQNAGGFWNVFSSKAGLKKVKSSQDRRYLKYADEVIDRKLSSSLKSEGATAVLNSIDSDLNELKAMNAECAEIKNFLDLHAEEHRKLEKSELEEAGEYREKMAEEYYDAIVVYGNYLYEKASSWIGENTPTEVLDLIEKILESQANYSKFNATRERLRKEAKVADYQALIKQERTKIMILEKEKEKIDNQIARHETEIRKLEMMIDRLEK